MSNSLIDEKIIVEFKEIFKEIQLIYKPILIGDGVANAFFLKYAYNNDVENSWRKTSNFIALKCQSKISDEFGKWNTYLFYICDNGLSIDLKYKIENDTFSSRKIVIEGHFDYDEIISSHILNNDLELTINERQSHGNFEPDELLWNLLEGRVLKKQKRTSAAESTFDELLILLKKDHSNEI